MMPVQHPRSSATGTRRIWCLSIVATTSSSASSWRTVTIYCDVLVAAFLPLNDADPDCKAMIINNPAGFYFSVHSPLHPGGFARGQLTRIQ
jgi:hypothetical protein